MASQHPVCRHLSYFAAVWLVTQSALVAQAPSSAKNTFDTFRSQVVNKGIGEPLHAKIVEVFKIDPPPRVFAGKIAFKSNGRDRLIWLGMSRTTPDVFFIDGNPADNTFITVFHADGSLQLRAAAAGNGYDELKPIATDRVAEQFQYVLRVSESFLAGTLKKLGQPR